MSLNVVEVLYLFAALHSYKLSVETPDNRRIGPVRKNLASLAESFADFVLPYLQIEQVTV